MVKDKVTGEQVTRESPKIYVECDAAHKAGIEHGVWVDCALSYEDAQKLIAEMLKASPVPSEGYTTIAKARGFLPFSVNSILHVEHALDVAKFINDYPAYGRELMAKFIILGQAQLVAGQYKASYKSTYEWGRAIAKEKGIDDTAMKDEELNKLVVEVMQKGQYNAVAAQGAIRVFGNDGFLK